MVVQVSRFSTFVFIMKTDVLAWNCQSVGNPKCHIFLKEYLWDFNLDIVVLMETRVSGLKVEQVIKSIGMAY